jgi:hypothetical protein
MATLLALGCSSPSPAGQAQIGTIAWEKAKEQLDVFFGRPSPENAQNLLRSLPSGQIFKEVGDRSGTMDLIDRNYTILETEVLAGNRFAAEALLRLLRMSDGAVAENILQTLGTLVRVNPQLFLKVLIRNREGHNTNSRMPVYGVGPGYFENPSACRYEYEMRIKSLESVGGAEYLAVITECVAELKSMIFKLSL